MMKVQVLLSTYNGSPFLEPLLASLEAQELQPHSVLIRDDGSTDSTWGLLKRNRYPFIQILPDKTHRGIVQSYYTLLQHSDEQAEYYAFCDQDDIWLPGKIRRAVGQLSKIPPELPGLYCSRQILINASQDILGLSWVPPKPPSFANAIVENIAVGCTVMFNRAARPLLLKGFPEEVIMHDWWAYLVVSAFGQVIYDPEPYVYYRQHKMNVIGTTLRPWSRWYRRLKRLRTRGISHPVIRQAQAFRAIHGIELGEAPRYILERFLERNRRWTHRITYALHPGVYRQSRFDDMILRLLIVLNRI